jgi:tetratricopeptide (TPR) repeat protein
MTRSRSTPHASPTSETPGDRSSPQANPAVTLVREGWNHLQFQRPLAAWAAWQRALRIAPGDPAAEEAIARFEAATDLPLAARAVYRFRTPKDPSRRQQWDVAIRERDHEELAAAVDTFGKLCIENRDDLDAWYNRGLCLAWLGRNCEAIAALDHAVVGWSTTDFPAAVEAWAIAEVLRQGGGAESLADDLRFTWAVETGGIDAKQLLADAAELVEMPVPMNPASDSLTLPNARLFEWLDRPRPSPDSTLDGAVDLPRVLASVVLTNGSIRFTSPDPESLESLQERIAPRLDGSLAASRREASPLPISLMDAGVWTFRLPRETEPSVESSLRREALEHYYENLWIHQPRHALGNLTPLEAARRAAAGAAVARAKLTSVVRVREQLGARPRVATLYNGYPFDRLRRRLGLELHDAQSIDPEDISCFDEAAIDRLDPQTLDPERLADAYRSAAGLRDDRRTARFAEALLDPTTQAPARVLTPPLFAVLVRESLKSQNFDRALKWLERGRTMSEPQHRRTYDFWSAEIYTRGGDADAALRTYQSYFDRPDDDRLWLLAAADDLLQHGFWEHATPLLREARADADRRGDALTLARADALLEQETGHPTSST